MGISYGGFIALEFARLYQERLHTLMLSGILLSREQLFELYQDISLRFYRVDPRDASTSTPTTCTRRSSARPSSARIPAEQFEAMRQRFFDRYVDQRHCLIRLTEAQDPFFDDLDDTLPQYRAIQTPTLMIAGAQDRAIPLWQQKKILRHPAPHPLGAGRGLGSRRLHRAARHLLPRDQGVRPDQEARLPVAGVIHHQVEGDGEPLVLLNGIAMSAAGWQPVARPLAQRFRVVRCDFLGQLMSPGEPHAQLDCHADDVVALLDHLALDRAHLVATSFGGAVGALVAAGHPERVRSLVTIASADGFTDGMASEVVRWRDAALAAGRGPDRGVLSDVLEAVVYSAGWLASHRAERAQRREQIGLLPERWFFDLAALLATARGASVQETLSAIRCPTLVIAAAEDGFIPRDRCRALAEAIRGAEFQIVEGAGHAVVVEQPAELVRRISAFLGALEKAP